MADSPCIDCRNYDGIKKGLADTRRGWCTVQSVYPAKEQVGQVFPPGVRRAEPGQLAQPFVVVGSETVRNCETFRSRR